jgi:hypothetical protein
LRRSVSTTPEANGGNFEIGPQAAQTRLLTNKNLKVERTHAIPQTRNLYQ